MCECAGCFDTVVVVLCRAPSYKLFSLRLAFVHTFVQGWRVVSVQEPLRAGDVVLRVNGRSMRYRKFETAFDLFASTVDRCKKQGISLELDMLKRSKKQKQMQDQDEDEEELASCDVALEIFEHITRVIARARSEEEDRKKLDKLLKNMPSSASVSVVLVSCMPRCHCVALGRCGIRQG